MSAPLSAKEQLEIQWIDDYSIRVLKPCESGSIKNKYEQWCISVIVFKAAPLHLPKRIPQNSILTEFYLQAREMREGTWNTKIYDLIGQLFLQM